MNFTIKVTDFKIAFSLFKVSTFEITLTLQQEQQLGTSIRSWFGQMTNGTKTIQVSSHYTITKVDLYRSARKSVTFHIWRSFNNQQILINNHYDIFCDIFLIKIFCNLNLSWISKKPEKYTSSWWTSYVRKEKNPERIHKKILSFFVHLSFLDTFQKRSKYDNTCLATFVVLPVFFTHCPPFPKKENTF